MEKIISVVVPCYNVEEYIDRCVNSLVKQTIGVEKLELIFVNDASTDRTLEKLQMWESMYPNDILVITYEENIRQGGARNVGMQYASCEYITFVDSDDWLELDMYETLYEYMKTEKFDMVQCRWIRDYMDERSIIDNSNREDREFHFESRGGFYRNDDEDCRLKDGSLVTMLLRRQILTDNDIWFPEKIAYEDNFFGYILRLYIKDVYIVDKVMYHYFVNMQSTITSRNSTHHFDRLKIEEALIEEYKRRGAYSFYEKELECDFIDRYYCNTMYILFTRFDEIPDVFNHMKRTILKLFPNFRQNPYIANLKKLEMPLLELLDFEGDLTMDELEIIKDGYLQALGRK